jgi:hypothetical protein
MAWTEQVGAQSWRVRYRTGDDHTVSISGFTTQRSADNYAANTTVATIVKLLSMILTDAADEGLIATNPIRRYRRRGRRSHRIERERVWATPTEVLRIANRPQHSAARQPTCSSSPPPGTAAAGANSPACTATTSISTAAS